MLECEYTGHPVTNLMSAEDTELLLKDGFLIGLLLLLIYTAAASLIEHRKIKWIHESGVAIICGLLTSFIFFWIRDFKEEGTFSFDKSIFFYCVLPPIIFAAGYNLKRRRFFSNIGGISLFGVVSTIVIFFSTAGLNLLINNFSSTTLQVYQEDEASGIWGWSSEEFTVRDILLMSALLCSSDPIAALTIVKYDEQPKLFSLIFGQGVINDAVSIILFQTVLLYTSPDQKFTSGTPISIILRFLLLSLTSLAIGVGVGLACACLLKKYRFFTKQPVHETAIVFFFGFLSYIISELLHQSGILALLFNGVTLAHYAWYNLSPQAKHGTSLAFQMIGFCCEAFIFAYLGLVFFSYLNRAWSFTMIAFELPIVAISRAIGIFGVMIIMRYICCKPFFLTGNEVTFQWFAGLIRGPIAFGLVMRLESEPSMTQTRKDIITTTTLVLVIFTTIAFGSVMPLLSKCLLTKHPHHHHHHHHRHSALMESHSKLIQSMHQPFLHPNMERKGSFYPGGNKEIKGTCKYYWKKFDHGIMKPIFIYKFDQINQKKDLEFFEGFMKAGSEWAQDYRQIGEIRHQTVHRDHTPISESSENDSDQAPEILIKESRKHSSKYRKNSETSSEQDSHLPYLGAQMSEVPERAEEQESPTKAATLLSFGKINSSGKGSQKLSDKEET